MKAASTDQAEDEGSLDPEYLYFRFSYDTYKRKMKKN